MKKISCFVLKLLRHSGYSYYLVHRGAFASFSSGGFTTMAVINPPERKLAK